MRTMRVFVLLATACTCAMAQDAQIFGAIRDPSSASVGGADVTLRNDQTGGTRNTKSNESGLYSLPALRPGTYRLFIRAVGFQSIVRDGIELNVGDNARIDFDLIIGSSQTTITVHGGSAVVNTADASVGTVIDRTLIDQLPLNGRGIQTLIELTPGVTVVPVVNENRGQFAINGQRSDANYFTVDGVSANFSVANSETLNYALYFGLHTAGEGGGGMLPANNFLGTFSNLLSPEALEEFKIQTSTYAPEFGHLPGGQIDLISRSGTNSCSGSLFEYLRNDATDANDWFNDAKGLPKPALRFNNFGGTFGGPIRLPHIYDGKDRTFFFFSGEALIIQQPQPVATMLVPTLSARQNAPAALAPLLNAYPLPSTNATTGVTPAIAGFAPFTGSSPLRYDQRTYALRLDHAFSEKIGVFLRFSHAPSERAQPLALIGTPSNSEHYTIGTDSITSGLTQTISSSSVNEIRFTVGEQSARDSAVLNETFGTMRPAISQFLPPGYSAGNSELAFRLAGNQGLSIDMGLISKNEARQIEGLDNLSYSRGAHLLKFGVDYRWFSPAQIVPVYTTFFDFNGIYQTTGTFVSTIPEIVTTVSSSTKTAYAVPTFAAYAQDTWRLSPRFTINYGLRWEIDPAPRVIAGQALVTGGLTSLDGSSTGFPVPAGQRFYPTRYGNVAPRIGIAWQLFNRDQLMTVLRAGGGVFFGSAQGGFEDSEAHGTVESIYDNQPLGSLGTGTPSQTFPGYQNFAIGAAPDYRLPIIYQWNVTLEHAIGSQTFSMGYVGAVGRRLIGSVSLLSLDSQVSVLGNDSSSSYNALQLQFNRRLSHRLQMLTSYTFSHSIDNLSQEIVPAFSFRSLDQYLHPDRDRGASDFDVRHSLNGAVIAELPAPRRGVSGALLRNWSANTIFFARSALPTDVIDGLTVDLRPNFVPGQPLYLYGPQYPGGRSYNVNAFTHSKGVVVEGDFGRNVLRGFGAWQIDFAMHRKFEFSERTSLEFRAEAFNILNHPNFANPSDLGAPSLLTFNFLNPPNWGQSTAMLANGLSPSLIPGELNPLFQIGGPRILQFALRLRY